jgi:hypothetical protein
VSSSKIGTVDERGGLRIVDYLRWAELNIYMTVHELSLTRTRQSGQGPNRYKNLYRAQDPDASSP